MTDLSLRLRRLWTLCRKETLQIIRDPSTLLIAFIFPGILLFIFGAGINLDSSTVTLGVVLEDTRPQAISLAESLANSPTFRVKTGFDAKQMGDELRAGRVRGFLIVRNDFSERALRQSPGTPSLLLITDGSEPNTASFVAAHVRGAIAVWQREELRRLGRQPTGIDVETRSWFNPSTESRNFLLPGSISIVMTVVGALLTALVIAREWERGTMEALLAAGITRFELLASKVLPYFVLGLISFVICVGLTRYAFGVPFRGSFGAVMLVGALFLGSALGLGLLLSTVLRSQFNAAQAALNAAFLPALMLSGFVFEISSMPPIIRAVTHVVPARYFVVAIQTVFQAGDVWSVLIPAFEGLGLAAVGFLGFTYLKTRRRLE
ncbi:MAG: ABC transporter permease [Myxococcales bacterium]|nr:ABC transporter permease [Myxococcales bacterium]